MEVWDTLRNIGDLKAAGPDGFGASFFKKTWSITGEELCNAIRRCFREYYIPDGVNTAYISLIPKTCVQNSPDDFRPISCCNVVYKIMSGIVGNRLKPILPHLIDRSQGAFVQGRSIIHNVCIAQQMMSRYGRKQSSKRCTLKIDLKKAYDSINWSFLEKVLEGLLFPRKFIEWCMLCVSTAKYSVLVNDEMRGDFRGQRGLRQGDPLSPFLFCLCMEYLSRCLNSLDESQGFRYHPKCHKLQLSHLLFADDILIFSEGSRESVDCIMRCLKGFLECSGMDINLAKSQFFTAGLNSMEIAQIRDTCNFERGSLPIKYLGIPLSNKNLSAADCSDLIKRMTARINAWNAKLLSRAGRVVLVRSVLHSICSYWARIFIIPVGIIKAVNAICANYIWKGSGDIKGGHRVNWDECCREFEEGGLGLKDLNTFNKALFLNHINELVEGKENIWTEWLKAYWLRCRPVWDADPRREDSWVVKNIWNRREDALQCWNSSSLPALWRGSGSHYSASNAYRTLRPSVVGCWWGGMVWKGFSVPSHAFTTWLAMRDRLLTKDKMLEWSLNIDPNCPFGCGCPETRDHLFFECRTTKDFWSHAMAILNMDNAPIHWNSICNWIQAPAIHPFRKKILAAVLSMVIHWTWAARNAKIFDRKTWSTQDVISKISWYLKIKLFGVEKKCKNKSELVWIRSFVYR